MSSLDKDGCILAPLPQPEHKTCSGCGYQSAGVMPFGEGFSCCMGYECLHRVEILIKEKVANG